LERFTDAASLLRLRTLEETNYRSHFTVTTIINVKIIRLAHLLFLSGMVVGLTMASPSLAATPNGSKSTATETFPLAIRHAVSMFYFTVAPGLLDLEHEVPA